VLTGFVFGVIGLVVAWAMLRSDEHRSFRLSR